MNLNTLFQKITKRAPQAPTEAVKPAVATTHSDGSDIRTELLQAFSSNASFFIITQDANSNITKFACDIRNSKHVNGKQRERNHKCGTPSVPGRNRNQQLDTEYKHKCKAMLQLIHEEALQGRMYTMRQFSEKFEYYAGLGRKRDLREKLNALATESYIKFLRNGTSYGLPQTSDVKHGYMCVKDMQLKLTKHVTTKIVDVLEPVYPSHVKSRHSGTVLQIEDPKVWIYHDDKMVI